ncbi:MAG: hypothetical protein IT383_10900 [Deltaproteobacteria bacterium]|nr:hypothetical protein [Deltaproteobacteria bacterium]
MHTTAAIRSSSPSIVLVEAARVAESRRSRLIRFALLPACALFTLVALALARVAPSYALADICIPPFDACVWPENELTVMLRVAAGLALGSAAVCLVAALRSRRLARDDERALGLPPGELGRAASWRRAAPESFYLRLR